MTIFPTHKTELKTKLSHHEILKRLENNDFYALGYSFKLEKAESGYALTPKRDTTIYRSEKSFSPPITNISIEQKDDNSTAVLRFYPLKRDVIISISGLAIILIFQIIVLAITAIHGKINFLAIIPLLVGIVGYSLCLLRFSVEVIGIRKQIEEAVEAEIKELSEEEQSKLQQWYEKDREPFNFRKK